MDVIAALVPSIGVGLLFWFVIRAVIHADRNERAALAAAEREERERVRAQNRTDDVPGTGQAGDESGRVV